MLIFVDFDKTDCIFLSGKSFLGGYACFAQAVFVQKNANTVAMAKFFIILFNNFQTNDTTFLYANIIVIVLSL